MGNIRFVSVTLQGHSCVRAAITIVMLDFSNTYHYLSRLQGHIHKACVQHLVGIVVFLL